MKKTRKNPGACPEFAASYATKKVPVVPPHYTIGDAEKFIKKNISDFASLDYIYVVDKGRLLGVFSMKKLYSHDTRSKIENLCKVKEMIMVGPRDKAVFAAYLSLKHKISTIPVVSEKGHFLGVITKNNILSILHRKHVEDRLIRAGIHRRHNEFDTMNAPVLKTIRFRLFWLIIGLFGGLLAAGIVNSFEETLSRNIMLAAFIPLVVYIADAVGTQLEAFSIRDFALHQRMDFSKYFLKQCLVVFIIAALLGAVSLALCMVLFGSAEMAVIIGVSILCATVSSILTGLLIPALFRKMKKDPAEGSGPIGTIIQDIMSVTIFFLIASLLL